MSGCGLICSDLGPGGDGAGRPRARAPLSAPGALAWMVPYRIKPKIGVPIRCRSTFRRQRLPDGKMKSIPPRCARPPLPGEKFSSPRGSPQGPHAGLRPAKF